MFISSTAPAIGFHSIEIPGGRSWSLATLLGAFLAEAELRYGPRDMSYTPVGIEFGGDVPMTWFPGNRRHVSILLTDSARENPAQAVFQLAHEVIHLLAPQGRAGAPVIEEGLATLFQHEKASAFCSITADLPSYLAAEALVKELLSHDGNAIRRARVLQPSFAAFTPELLLGVCPGLRPETAAALCAGFGRT